MLGRVKRHWWRFVGLAFILCAMWFYHKEGEADQRLNQQMEETDNKWREIEKQLLEKAAAIQKATDLIEQSRVATEIISLQTEQYKLQRESLKTTQDLYFERRDCETYAFILIAVGFTIINFGLWRAGLSWKRTYLAMRKARRCEMEIRQE